MSDENEVTRGKAAQRINVETATGVQGITENTDF
jgi:hypothetical protein